MIVARDMLVGAVAELLQADFALRIPEVASMQFNLRGRLCAHP